MTLGKSLEDYLETILILKIKKGMVRSIDVADYMEFSKPSGAITFALTMKSSSRPMTASAE